MFIRRKVFRAFIVVCYVPVAPLGLRCTGFWHFYTPSRSLSHSLSIRLIPSGAFKCWCAVRTLQMYFSNGLISVNNGARHGHMRNQTFRCSIMRKASYILQFLKRRDHEGRREYRFEINVQFHSVRSGGDCENGTFMLKISDKLRNLVSPIGPVKRSSRLAVELTLVRCGFHIPCGNVSDSSTVMGCENAEWENGFVYVMRTVSPSKDRGRYRS